MSTQHPEFEIDDLLALSKAKGFLGQEFLTWLWFNCDDESGKIVIHDPNTNSKHEAEYWIDDQISLSAGSGLAHEQWLKGGDPAKSAEATLALASGKTVRELKLGVNIHPYGEFFATLGAEDLSPRGLRLPDFNKPENAADPDQPQLVNRLRATELYLQFVRELFSKFMAVRASDSWDKETVKTLQDWIAGKLAGISQATTVH
jgi:hypothetical protein